MTCFVGLVILRILQYKMNYSLSVERIVRALDMCICSEISKGIIHVLKKDTFKDFKTKLDNDGIEYSTLQLSDLVNETVKGFKTILNYFETGQFTSIMNKALFDKQFKKIKSK